MTYSVTVNFGGFYESIHGEQLERGVASYFDFDDPETGEIDREKLYSVDSLTWKDARDKYCEEWLSILNSEIDTEMEFYRLDSPQYYNFYTDTIDSRITRADTLTLFKYIRNNDLKQVVIDRIKDITTSKDGYIAHYRYSEVFDKGNRWLLLTCLIDVIIADLEESYPIIVESFYPNDLFVEEIAA